MTNIEITTSSSGNIGIMDRAVRIVIGMSILVGALFASGDVISAYPWIKSFAAVVVLTGIAGWDPLYSLYRSLTGNGSSNAALPKTSLNPS